jgi:penicillin-binding protein 1A
MRKTWIIVISIILVTIAVPTVFIIAVYSGVFGHLQTREELLNYKNAAASVVLSEEGEIIGKIFSENRTNISYKQIPAHLINALVATEDARFFDHVGIDSRSLLRVLFKTVLFRNRNSGGGSTITQQLAKNMFGRKNFGILTIFINKTKETFLAHRLEKIFTKEEILTLYLNTVSFGENVYGIEAASVRYFNKKVELLNIEESAVLIGILKANNYYNPRLHPENAKSRRNIVLNQLKKYNYLNAQETDSLCKLPLIQNYSNIEYEGPADYFVYQVKNEVKQILHDIKDTSGKEWNIEEDGLIITTTLNLTLQNYANTSFHDHLSVMQKKLNEQYKSASGKNLIEELAGKELKNLNLSGRANDVSYQKIFDWNGSYSDSISVRDSLENNIRLLQAGLIVMDPVSGAVKAWVGGIDFKTQPYDQILARRQLASTFKPILYSTAFEDGMKPCDYLDNDSIVFSGIEDWSPENFDHSHGGKYSLEGALVKSMNIPTFNLYQKVGFDKLDSLWKNMGFSFTLDNTPSLAMGTAEANIKEVAIAYSSFANGGYRILPQTLVSIKTPDGEVIWQNEFNAEKSKILSERTAGLICAILQKAIREGTGVSMASKYGVTLPLAGKTGTSQSYADAWFTAFNPSLVIVSRVGASSPLIHFNNGSDGSGSALALPLVAMTLKKVEMNRELSNKLITPFPVLTPELMDELDCPDFKEKSFFDKLIDNFRGDRISSRKGVDKDGKKKPGFFKRLFGRKNRI